MARINAVNPLPLTHASKGMTPLRLVGHHAGPRAAPAALSSSELMRRHAEAHPAAGQVKVASGQTPIGWGIVPVRWRGAGKMWGAPEFGGQVPRG
jgi:hypothetical protein